MYKLCKTEQSAARQRQLELGLMEAMASQHYDEISVSDLCDRMQIPRKSFYRYFSGKDGALKALVDHTLLEFEGFSVIAGTVEDRTKGFLEDFFLFWQRHKVLLDALDRSGLSGVLIERSVMHALADTSVVYHFRDEQAAMLEEHATSFAVCGLMSMVLQWHKEGFKVSASRMATIAVHIVTHPLFKI